MQRPDWPHKDKTPQGILQDMTDYLEQDLGSDVSTYEGTFTHDILMSAAVAIHQLYAAMEALQYQVWVIPESGPYIDYAATSQGIAPRKEGVAATVWLSITGDAGHMITENTGFSTKEDLRFYTNEDVVILETKAALPPFPIQNLRLGVSTARATAVFTIALSAHASAPAPAVTYTTMKSGRWR